MLVKNGGSYLHFYVALGRENECSFTKRVMTVNLDSGVLLNHHRYKVNEKKRTAFGVSSCFYMFCLGVLQMHTSICFMVKIIIEKCTQ